MFSSPVILLHDAKDTTVLRKQDGKVIELRARRPASQNNISAFG
jgi:hypothetical protein